MRKRRNFLLFFICSFLLNCPTTEEQMLYFTIFCLFRHSFIIKNLHGDKLKQTLHLGEVVVRDKQDIEKYAESNKYHAEDTKKITYGIPN